MQKQAVEEEQEQELEVTGAEAEHAREQRQVGNQAIQSRMSGAGSSAPAEGGGGGLALRQEAGEHEGPAHGGDDEPSPGPPPTLEEIIASWNPRTQAPPELQMEPSGAGLHTKLPRPDAAWVQEVRSLPPPDVAYVPTVASLLQPPPEAIAGGLDSWAKTVSRLLGSDPVSRCLSVLLLNAPSCLQDPQGRPLHGRIYRASLGIWALLDSPIGALNVDDPKVPFLDFLLDLSSQREAVAQAKQLYAEDQEQTIPEAETLTTRLLPPNTSTLTVQTPDHAVQQHLLAVLKDLMNLAEPHAKIPSSFHPQPHEPDPEEDPLELDRVLAAFTGPAPDPDEALLETAIRAAEGLGSSCVTLRIQMAGVLSAFGGSCQRWSHGPPTPLLIAIARHVDLQTRKIFELLVEIARAGRARTVPYPGLRNGLRRAASQCVDLQNEALEAVGKVMAGLLPLPPAALPAPEAGDDPISIAWADGTLPEALSWARTLPPSPTRELVIILLECQLSPPSEAHVASLHHAIGLAEELDRPFLARALEIVFGATHMWVPPSNQLESVTARQKASARVHRHGFAYAAATIWDTEVLWRDQQHQASREARTAGGGVLFHMGSPASLDALARWTPAEPDH